MDHTGLRPLLKVHVGAIFPDARPIRKRRPERPRSGGRNQTAHWRSRSWRMPSPGTEHL